MNTPLIAVVAMTLGGCPKSDDPAAPDAGVTTAGTWVPNNQITPGCTISVSSPDGITGTAQPCYVDNNTNPDDNAEFISVSDSYALQTSAGALLTVSFIVYPFLGAGTFSYGADTIDNGDISASVGTACGDNLDFVNRTTDAAPHGNATVRITSIDPPHASITAKLDCIDPGQQALLPAVATIEISY